MGLGILQPFAVLLVPVLDLLLLVLMYLGLVELMGMNRNKVTRLPARFLILGHYVLLTDKNSALLRYYNKTLWKCIRK